MTGSWNLVLIISTMYTGQSGRLWVTAQSPKPGVYQSDKKLSVDIGNSATLQCCLFEKVDEEIIWFKQQNRKQPQIIVRFFKTAGETFYSEFQNPRFRIKKHGNCFNMTISNTTMSDEATYYCALVFADGTYLKIKGDHVTTASETSKPALCDNSVVCEPTLHGNNSNMNTHKKTVLGLGMALGLCALLIFCLIYFILRRRKLNASIEDSPGMRESDAETLNYAALQFAKRKAKADKRKTGLSEDCVYSDVK
ncbi:novel immune-type receptor 13 [Ictalurus punctatus]|uniref:Novel immune-type receptor 13 n=1 Tax=Ictalurus punctatus TaxID=7998 RepID=A4UU50_ICTPU|nr:novel immune-type receptor 13 [Ictalurus punctatus]ABP02019.1 novel immune-type receptor 13 [Ictalurus punctatus]